MGGTVFQLNFIYKNWQLENKTKQNWQLFFASPFSRALFCQASLIPFWIFNFFPYVDFFSTFYEYVQVSAPQWGNS